LDINLGENETRNVNLNPEINANRIVLRNSKLFESTLKTDFTNLMNTKKIQSEFLNCVGICESNRDEYYRCHLEHTKPCMKNVVAYEADLLTCMNTNTNKNIRDEIIKKLETLPESQSSSYRSSMKNCNKEQLCGILQSVEEELEGYE